ncbi:heavy metal-translocating P-type ATPase [Clostridium sp. CAG:433]|nr:heavy metal-translocating P-type ATPase [Clostridium sp. CAG:433]
MNILKKYKYRLNNLDCANCANKIEERLKKENNLSDVVVNFSSLTLSFMSNDDIKIEDISDIVTKIEPEVVVTKIDEEVKETKKNYNLIRLIIGVIIALLGLYVNFDNEIINKILIIASYVILLYRTFKVAVKMLIKSHTINENALITISAIGAYFVDKQMEGLMVIILYEIGKILEEKAVNNSRNSIKDLMNIKQDFANKVVGDKTKVINVEDVKINDILIIKKGEKIPVDGIVIEGETKLNLFSLTGESDLVNKKENDEVLSGSINEGKVIKIKATKLFNDSTVSKILSLIEDATDKKSKTETFVAKMAKYYTPIVLIISVITFICFILFTDLTTYESIYRALVFLVISCPCAIAISVPLSYFTGIGVSSKNGILVKGSNYLDLLSRVNKIVFDKTGTLTSGAFKVTSFNLLDSSYSEDYILKLYALGENLSNHPIAKSIMNYVNIDVNEKVKNHKEIEGLGVSYTYDDKKIKIGNNKMFDIKDDGSLNIYLSIDDKIVSSLTINDGIKEGVENTLNELSKKGIETYMFTGDSKENALSISEKLNIDKVYYELLPTEKYEKLEELLNDKDVVAFIGDGINDAPSLKRADIGISMGSIGSSSAIEASDIVIMDDDISKINKAISISNKVKRIIKENLVFSIGVKILILVLSAIGIANMWQAVFADVGVTIISILNTLRIMKK